MINIQNQFKIKMIMAKRWINTDRKHTWAWGYVYVDFPFSISISPTDRLPNILSWTIVYHLPAGGKWTSVQSHHPHPAGHRPTTHSNGIRIRSEPHLFIFRTNIWISLPSPLSSWPLTQPASHNVFVWLKLSIDNYRFNS